MSSRASNRSALVIATLVALSLSAVFAIAQDQPNPGTPAESEQAEDDPSIPSEDATQRLDFAVDYYDSEAGSVLRGGVNFNWAPLSDHSFAATLPVLDANLADVEGSGIGDLLLRYNWVPALTLTADPWVPNNLGIGIGLLVPTGDAAKGTGGDQWVIAPSLGWAARLGKRTTLLPQLQYMKSFAEGELAQGVEAISLSLGIVHVTRGEFWVQYEPSASYDFDAEEYEIDHLLVLGQQFTRRLAVSLELRTLNVADLQDPAGDGREHDHRATLKLHWILAF